MRAVGRFAGAVCLGALVLALVAVLAGCGGSGLSASSSCSDFMEAAPEDQASTISKLSTQFDTPEIATPLGSPGISYTCASNPEMSLEEVFHSYHAGES